MYVSSFPFFHLIGNTERQYFSVPLRMYFIKIMPGYLTDSTNFNVFKFFSFYTFWILLLHNRKITRTLMQPPQYRTVLSDTKRTLYHGISVDKNHIKLLHPILFSIAKPRQCCTDCNRNSIIYCFPNQFFISKWNCQYNIIMFN